MDIVDELKKTDENTDEKMYIMKDNIAQQKKKCDLMENKPFDGLHLEPLTLCMVSQTRCLICGKMDNEWIEHVLGYLYGWIACSECVQKKIIHNAVIEYVNKFIIIPFDFLYNYDKEKIDDYGQIVFNFFK